MGKELSNQAFIISIIIIFLAALVFIGALYYVLNKDVLLNSITYSPVSKEPTSFSLQLNSPEDNALLTDPNLLIRGKTASFASVIVTNGDATLGFEADKNGEFSKIMTLKEGPNSLTINSFDKLGISKSVNKQVYYSKEKIDDEK